MNLRFALLIAFAFLAASSAQAQDVAPDRLMIRFERAPQCANALPTCWPEAYALLSTTGAVLEGLHPIDTHPALVAPPRIPTPLDRSYVAKFRQDTDVSLLTTELMALPGVELVTPDPIGHAGSWRPLDAFFPDQWALEQANDHDIDAIGAWAQTRGSANVVIAVLDSGVDLTHPDLVDRLSPRGGRDFVNNDLDPSDDLGHGTNVAGIALASSAAAPGVVGVCPECTLLPVKILDDQERGYYDVWIQAITWSVDQGADVINLSVGGATDNSLLRDAVLYAHDNGVVVVACMMNENTDAPFYPAAFPEAIAVGATNEQDQRADPFEWGGGSSYGDHIDLVAPGNNILGPAMEGGYQYWAGTSQAAPMVSGAVGLLLSLAPSLSTERVRDLLHASAEDQVGPPAEDTNGFDPYFGHGRLNLTNLMAWASPDTDHDGFIDLADCAPSDPEVNPDALEIPHDGIDENCDGIDEAPIAEAEWDDDLSLPYPTGHKDRGLCSVLVQRRSESTSFGPWFLVLAALVVGLRRRRPL